MRIRIRIRGFWFYSWKKTNFSAFLSLHEGHRSYRRYLQAGKIQHFKYEISFFGLFCPLDPNPADHNVCGSMRIRIHNTESLSIDDEIMVQVTLELDWKAMGKSCATKDNEDFTPCVFRIRGFMIVYYKAMGNYIYTAHSGNQGPSNSTTLGRSKFGWTDLLQFWTS